MNPLFIDHYRERDYDIRKPRIAVYRCNWCCSEKRIAVSSNAIKRDHHPKHFTCGVHRKGGVRKSGVKMYNKTFQSRTLPQRIVLKPNLHYGRQVTTSCDATTSFDHSCKQRNLWRWNVQRTCRGEIDFMILELIHSTVQEQDHTRKDAVQKLIHQFETHPNRAALQADLKQNHASNPFSEQSKEMIYSMGNMEYFEICEISPKIQCSNCMTHWTKRHCILYLRNMLATFRLNSKIKQRPLRCSVDSQLRDKERPISRCTSRKHREAKNLSRSSRLIQKGKEKWLQINVGQITE